MKREGKLSFHDHTSMVACLVSRFGRRDGRHIYLEDDELSHTVAAAVLLTVLVDLEDQNGYFGPVLGCAEPVENLTKGVDDKLHFSDSSAAEPLAKTKLEKEVIRDI